MSKRSKPIQRQPAPTSLTGSGTGDANAPCLPVRRSFVVQFVGPSTTDEGRFEGRIEHIVSGATSRFSGEAELIHQLERALRESPASDSAATQRP